MNKQRALRRKNAQQKRPNVIVIDTDDHERHRHVRDAEDARACSAPSGTTFQNSYVSYPLCCPSRATFLTGQYAHNHGVLHRPALRRPRQHEHPRGLAAKRAKYRTAMVGKYLNGYGVVRPQRRSRRAGRSGSP